MTGLTLSMVLFSVGGFPGRNSVPEVPVEVVPILSTITLLNRYFFNPAVLIENRPCNLAAFCSSRKKGQPNGARDHGKRQERGYGPKIRGVP